MKKIILLGASGNIGTQVLKILKKNKFCLVAFSVGEENPIKIIDNIVKEFANVSFICVRNKKHISFLKQKYQNIDFYYGDNGLKKIIRNVDADIVFNALSGFVGLKPTLEAIFKGMDIALANKESLVVGGQLIKNALKRSKSVIYPVDSEHSAIFKCLQEIDRKNIEKIIITASGGAFRDLTRSELKNVTKEQALKHPTWNMGKKITIDSATMINKGFELIEAYYLFDFSIDKMEILMHKESFVHAIIKTKNYFIGEVCKPNMLNPIEYALTLNKKLTTIKKFKNINEIGNFHFMKFDQKRFPMVKYVLKAFKMGGAMLCVINAADEMAVELFLKGKITFLDIERIVNLALKKFASMKKIKVIDFYILKNIDKEVKNWIKKIK